MAVVSTRSRERSTAHPTDSDQVLVERARHGDAAAFALLHDRYAVGVARLVRAETRNQADVTDLVQETFASAWARLASLRQPDRFRAWLFQIARHTVIDHARNRARRPALDTDDDLALALTPSDESGPADIAELLELAERLDVALDGLSRRDAVAITLVAQLGFGPTELGDALDVTPNNAKVILHRARRRLRSTLGDV